MLFIFISSLVYTQTPRDRSKNEDQFYRKRIDNMGNLIPRRRANDNLDASGNAYIYYYPPKGGKFFGTTFIMGGDKFDMSQPESYLFGENYDLNYLGGRPNPFPYSAPMPNEPMQMLRAMINIRKETLKLTNPPTEGVNKEGNTAAVGYTIEFLLDTEVDCAITFYLQSREEATPNGVKYITKQVSETFHYKAGIGQQFSERWTGFNPANCGGELTYNAIDEKGEFNSTALYPFVIHCVATVGEEPRQSHSLIASVEKNYDSTSFAIKPLKQKIFVDGLSYLIQEVYGIENKINHREVTSSNENARTSSFDEESDNSFECVICMSDIRDTLILPCRHLCLCSSCANSLRYQANNCPICRVPFRALLQLKAVRKTASTRSRSIGTTTTNAETFADLGNDIPPGFEALSLVEALNGLIPRCNSIDQQQHNVIADNAADEELEITAGQQQQQQQQPKQQAISNFSTSKISLRPKENSSTTKLASKEATTPAKGDSASVSIMGTNCNQVVLTNVEDGGSSFSSSSASSSSSSSSTSSSSTPSSSDVAENVRLIPAKISEMLTDDEKVNKQQSKNTKGQETSLENKSGENLNVIVASVTADHDNDTNKADIE